MADPALDRMTVALEARITSFEKELKRAAGIFDAQSRKIERRQTALQAKITRSFSSLGRSIVPPLGGIAAALSVREILRYADAWTDAGNKIAASGTPLEDRAVRLRELADLAVETRTAFAPTVNTFSRLARSTEGLNVSEEKLLTLTETINKAFIVGGAAASEQAAGILQLSQGIASGVLAGDELKSVRENAALIARAIADAMGVSIGELKKLGAEGKITVDVILKALDSLGPKLDRTFAKTTVTIGQSLTNLETRFTQFVGGLSESGVTAGLASGIETIANNLDLLAAAAAIAAAALGPGLLAGAVASSAVGFGTLTAAILANPFSLIPIVAAAATVALVLYGRETTAATVAQEALNEAQQAARDRANGLKTATDGLAKSQRQLAIDAEDATLALQRQAAQDLRQRAISLQTSAPGRFRQGQRGAGTGFQSLETLQEAIRIADAQALQTEARLSRLLNQRDDRSSGERTAAAGKTKGDAFSSAVKSIERQTAVLAAQGGVLNRTTFELERAEAAARLLTAAEQAGKKETPELTAEIDRLATAFGRAAAQRRFAEELGRGDERIREIEQEVEALGLSAAQRDALRFKQELLNAAMDDFDEITPEVAAQIEASAEQYERQAEAAEAVARAIQNQIDLADASRDALVDIGLAGIDGFGSMKQAAAQALEQVSRLIVEMLILRPLVESLTGQGGTAFGGGLGDFFAGFFARGGTIPTGQFGIVGENGPEPVAATGGGIRVLPNSSLRSLSAVSVPAVRGASATPSVNFSVAIDATGADSAGLARVERAIDRLHSTFDARAVSAVMRTKKGGGTPARLL